MAHQGATDDVLRASDPAVSASFRRSAARAVAARRFSAIVTESAGPPDGFPPGLARSYRRCPQALLPGVPQAVFQPPAGPPGRPAYVWRPDAASCAAAVRVLNGPAAAATATRSSLNQGLHVTVRLVLIPILSSWPASWSR